MAKKDKNQNEVSIIWDFITCAVLYAAICYFNGPDKQRELSQDQVRKFALIASVAWFFIVIIIMAKQGTKVVLFKHKKDKSKKKAAGKKAADKAFESAKESVFDEPKTYILKDPASGAERLFIKDEDGRWVSEDGQSILNTEDLDEWIDQRESDRQWQDEANRQIADGESTLDKKLRELDEEVAKENARLDKELAETLKRIEKYGTSDDDTEHLKEIIRRQQRLDEIASNRELRKAIVADIGYKGASSVKYLTDKSFDVIGKVGGTAGKIGKAVYTGLTDQAQGITEAAVNGQDLWKASKKAAVDSVASIAEDQLEGGAKYVGTIVGEAARDMGKAMIDGKEGLSALKDGLEGSARGLFKANAENVGEALGGFVGQGGSEMMTDSAGNITQVFVDDGDIVSQLVQDGSNAAYDSFAESVEKMKKTKRK